MSRAASPGVRSMSVGDARRLLVAWHFRPSDIRGVFERFGSIQYDPLRPLGTNVDLVLQARVPGYELDAWQQAVYDERLAFDGWDKQASLVRMRDWPRRRIYHRWQREWWHTRVFEKHPQVVDDVLAELAARGPLASTDFEDGRRTAELAGSWHGTSLTKHALRALWHTGQVATHHRRHGHHVYDLRERVIPADVLARPEPPESDQLHFLVAQRHRAMGLTRPNAPVPLWSLEISTPERLAIIEDLVAEGTLVAIDVDGVRYHAHRDVLAAFEGEANASDPVPVGESGSAGDRIRFIAPLDPFLWDRTAVAQLFSFDYVWEVYKPKSKRIWGYYVLPVLYGDRLVGRFDARASDRGFELHRFWLEDGMVADARFIEALEDAFATFLRYLGVDRTRANPNRHAVSRPVRDALKAAALNTTTQAGKRTVRKVAS